MADRIGYIRRLVGSIVRRDETRRISPRARRLAGLGFLCALTLLAAIRVPAAPAAMPAAVDGLSSRALQMATLLGAAEQLWQQEIGPIDRVLRNYRNEPELTRRIAASVVREARRSKLEPRLLLAVLLVENPWLDVDAVSSAGARGLMQVMPFHLGSWPQCGDRLDDIDSNICHGAAIFANYLGATDGDIDRALLRYNGCVTGAHTPNCQQYPQTVYARAGRASILAWYRSLELAATP